MKLSTVANGSRDGRLVVVSSDHARAALADGIAATLQEALECWTEVEGALRDLAIAVEAGTAPGLAPHSAWQFLAPLPRAWQWLDGSAFESHGALMAKVFKMDPAPRDRPLMYQGLSDRFYAATEDIPFVTEADGIDFEGEFGVVVDEVPLGCGPDEAAAHIRLVVQINDWSLRHLAPIEMKTGFGWVQAKPACSMAPVAVTPDELGAAWRDGRVDLSLEVHWNSALFGRANGHAMSFSFPELVAHAARTRSLCAGTVIGSGTVSNANHRDVGSSCIAERRGIELLDDGKVRTAFMSFGDRVRMEARSDKGEPLFGAIDQRVVRAHV
ncbi:fumarylacetoacetate hydrolase family protein [Nitrospirillum sp. BR 11828]|uniref:fumarylacetoacetate hydrolase family protein n=1 Tax=Nitrospirillum sp. BR 11828 TaxID=3104325 RepID=UPI002ACA38DB|nr:fumarylacetoacetate hydrolase family protein [Nitrospirillum sp. BR 11828]MDZ5646017.1 fumarylacetoacetate hydrolase family protein [Nitrospirillum sp. BR 11828]